MRTILLLGAIAAAANSLNARLEFATTTVRLQADAGAETPVRTEFTFINRGDKPIRIVSIQPACGCTTTTLEKTVFSAGETGVIPITFSVGALTGRSVKSIAVATDEPANNHYTLSLDVDIVEWFSLSPRLLFWRPNEEPAPKELIVTLANDRVRVAGIEAPADLFQAKLKQSGDPRKVTIVVTPLTRKPGANALLTLRFEVVGKREFTRKIYLRILPDASMPPPF